MVNYFVKEQYLFPIDYLFIDLSNRNIKFTPNGDGIGTYDIFQYQIINSSNILDYRTIGQFSDIDHSNDRLKKIFLFKKKYVTNGMIFHVREDYIDHQFPEEYLCINLITNGKLDSKRFFFSVNYIQKQSQ